jgi:hypothetical protein
MTLPICPTCPMTVDIVCCILFVILQGCASKKAIGCVDNMDHTLDVHAMFATIMCWTTPP